MDRQRYPVGIQTFSEIREKGFLYIDKTRFIQHYLPFLGSGKKIVCIGLNFSKKARNIEQWIITSV